MPERRTDQDATLGGVVAQVALGPRDRFAHFDVAREMNDDLRLVAKKNVFDESAISDVAALKRSPADRPVMAFFQRVQADRLGTGLGQRLADVAADVAGAAGYEHRTRNRKQ